MNKRTSIMLLQLCFIAVSSAAMAANETFTCVGTLNPTESTEQTVIEITPDENTFTAEVRVSTVQTKMICGLKLVSSEPVSQTETAIRGGCGQERIYQTSVGELSYFGDFANATLGQSATAVDMECSLGTTEEYVKQLQSN